MSYICVVCDVGLHPSGVVLGYTAPGVILLHLLGVVLSYTSWVWCSVTPLRCGARLHLSGVVLGYTSPVWCQVTPLLCGARLDLSSVVLGYTSPVWCQDTDGSLTVTIDIYVYHHIGIIKNF